MLTAEYARGRFVLPTHDILRALCRVCPMRRRSTRGSSSTSSVVPISRVPSQQLQPPSHIDPCTPEQRRNSIEQGKSWRPARPRVDYTPPLLTSDRWKQRKTRK